MSKQKKVNEESKAGSDADNSDDDDDDSVDDNVRETEVRGGDSDPPAARTSRSNRRIQRKERLIDCMSTKADVSGTTAAEAEEHYKAMQVA